MDKDSIASNASTEHDLRTVNFTRFKYFYCIFQGQMLERFFDGTFLTYGEQDRIYDITVTKVRLMSLEGIGRKNITADPNTLGFVLRFTLSSFRFHTLILG